jgi:hypothetical protein
VVLHRNIVRQVANLLPLAKAWAISAWSVQGRGKRKIERPTPSLIPYCDKVSYIHMGNATGERRRSVISGRGIVRNAIVSVALLLGGFGHPAMAAGRPELQVAVSLDIPPFVMDKGASGLEVDILRQALLGYTLRFIQLPYEELQTAVQRKRADVSAGVQRGDDGVYYSVDFVTFVNYAISKAADGFRIDRVADLKDHQVLTWENAYLELGGEFEAMFSPRSSQRKNYIEVADQMDQVRKFWDGKGLVLVIDRSIFEYFSR